MTPLAAANQTTPGLTSGEQAVLTLLAETDTGEKYLKGADRYFYRKLATRGLVEPAVEHRRTLKGKITNLGRDAVKA